AIFDEDEQTIFDPGDPVFSSFFLYSRAIPLITVLPFEIDFSDSRDEVQKKAGPPIRTNQGYANLLKKQFLIDSYKLGDIIMTLDYSAAGAIELISFRDNNLVDHLKL